MPEFYPDIYEYLDSTDNSKSIRLDGMEDAVLEIRSRTGLSKDVSELILKYFFQEIRNAMLRGDEVSIYNFGKFFISSPKSSNNKERIFPKFKAYKPLVKKINE